MADYGRQIKKFWKPDGQMINLKNDAAIRKWMGTQGLSMQAGAVTALIHSPVHQSARAALVKTILQTSPIARTGRSK